MDIKIIEEKFPKSWEMFLKYSGLKTAWHPFDDPKWFRQLYDFFDENGIHVEIGIDRTLEAKYAPYVCWIPFWTPDSPIEDMYKGEFKTWQDEFLYRTRPEAEKCAFMKSFEILENKNYDS